ncbi:MAG: hypothetical protein IT349_08755 [Candidatus Eisenbacteria bacterium]|nr:hypothetical protein [Candidatus Eisenbacteria bacterium]
MLGLWIWSKAKPETLPVPALDGDQTPIVREQGHPVLGPLTRIGFWIGLLLAGAVLGIGALQKKANVELRDRFQISPGSMSLTEVAEQIEVGARGPVSFLYPGYPPRLDRMAQKVREGTEPLRTAARAYAEVAESVNQFGLAGRLAHGAERVGPLASSLSRVRSFWHQETTSWKEMQAALAPYLVRGSGALPPLRGVVRSTTSDHAVILSVIGSDGATRTETAALQAGARFQLPIEEGALLVLTDLERRPGEPYRVVDELRLTLATWSDREISFGRSGASVRVNFDDELERRAPAFPPLSPAARKELGL